MMTRLKKRQPLVVEGKAGRGRGRKTWLEGIRGDMRELRLRVDDGEARPFFERLNFG